MAAYILKRLLLMLPTLLGVLLIGFMLLHNGLIWFRKVRLAKRNPARVVERMNRNQRRQHAAMALSFIARFTARLMLGAHNRAIVSAALRTRSACGPLSPVCRSNAGFVSRNR